VKQVTLSPNKKFAKNLVRLNNIVSGKTLKSNRSILVTKDTSLFAPPEVQVTVGTSTVTAVANVSARGGNKRKRNRGRRVK